MQPIKKSLQPSFRPQPVGTEVRNHFSKIPPHVLHDYLYPFLLGSGITTLALVNRALWTKVTAHDRYAQAYLSKNNFEVNETTISFFHKHIKVRRQLDGDENLTAAKIKSEFKKLQKIKSSYEKNHPQHLRVLLFLHNKLKTYTKKQLVYKLTHENKFKEALAFISRFSNNSIIKSSLKYLHERILLTGKPYDEIHSLYEKMPNLCAKLYSLKLLILTLLKDQALEKAIAFSKEPEDLETKDILMRLVINHLYTYKNFRQMNCLIDEISAAERPEVLVFRVKALCRQGKFKEAKTIVHTLYPELPINDNNTTIEFKHRNDLAFAAIRYLASVGRFEEINELSDYLVFHQKLELINIILNHFGKNRSYPVGLLKMKMLYFASSDDLELLFHFFIKAGQQVALLDFMDLVRNDENMTLRVRLHRIVFSNLVRKNRIDTINTYFTKNREYYEKSTEDPDVPEWKIDHHLFLYRDGFDDLIKVILEEANFLMFKKVIDFPLIKEDQKSKYISKYHALIEDQNPRKRSRFTTR